MVVYSDSDFKAITQNQLSIIYEYLLSCKNEDASETIYLKLGCALVQNEDFLMIISGGVADFTNQQQQVIVDKLILATLDYAALCFEKKGQSFSEYEDIKEHLGIKESNMAALKKAAGYLRNNGLCVALEV